MMGEPKQPGAKTNIPSDGHPPDIQRIGDFFLISRGYPVDRQRKSAGYPADGIWVLRPGLS